MTQEPLKFVGYGMSAIAGMEMLRIVASPIIGNRWWIYGIIMIILIIYTPKIAQKFGA